jgi:hypothetical protein
MPASEKNAAPKMNGMRRSMIAGDGRRPGQPKVSSDEERDRMTRDRLNAIEEET